MLIGETGICPIGCGVSLKILKTLAYEEPVFWCSSCDSAWVGAPNNEKNIYALKAVSDKRLEIANEQDIKLWQIQNYVLEETDEVDILELEQANRF